MSRVFVADWRLIALILGILGGFGAVWARLYQLHVVDRAELRAFASTARDMTIPVGARRGDIVDARGNILAATRPRYQIGLDPQMVRAVEDREKLLTLSAMLNVPISVIEEKLARKTFVNRDGETRAVQWARLAEVTPEVHEQVRKLGLKGVYGNLYFERYYPNGELASHVLGYLNKEGTPVLGVEQYLDFFLRGQDGWRETEGDVRRRELVQFRDREVEARDGFEVQLTLDSVVQSVVEETIAGLVEKYDPDGVSIIVSDPTTGEILGLANYPTFDPNEFWKSNIADQRNRAVTDLYEPGSTFKIVPVAGAMEEHLVHPGTLIDCSAPTALINGHERDLPDDHGNLGTIPVSTIVAKSSNRGAAQLGIMLGPDRLYDYAHRFGFGERSEWGPIGEVRGILHPTKNWDGLTITRLPAGYAVAATPMQVHLAMSAVANGGMLMRPQLIREIRDPQGQTVLTFHPQERHAVISEETARALATMLAKVPTTEGTARNAAIPGFEAAGKTGTARKIIDGGYSHQNHCASFSGFFPARAPRLAITVMVDNAKREGVAYGGVVAGPAFSEIGRRLVDYYAIRPVEGDDPENPTYAFVQKGFESR
jgi:cell division protein FtsI (penicillin-binding protein 3)/stage V sporulation protein D (sporulation-specific penicillin-binding protein)